MRLFPLLREAVNGKGLPGLQRAGIPSRSTARRIDGQAGDTLGLFSVFAEEGNGNPKTTACGRLERLPKWLICVPLFLQVAWLGIRYRSATLPSTVNANITSGGLIGEGKLEYFTGMGSVARSFLAKYCAVEQGLAHTDALERLLSREGLAFPLIAKPDIGFCGYGVRLVHDLAGLEEYLAAFPEGETVVVQEYLPQEGEAGIFYARDPQTGEGKLTGMALRYFPRVAGDGRHTVRQLIDGNLRLHRLLDPAHQISEDGLRVPAAGEVVRLAVIGSTRVGGLYRDGSRHLTPQLQVSIDAIARDMPDFHFGRFDVRFDSLDELRGGRGFKIMEVNGAGSEAIQAWDPELSLSRAFGIIFSKQRMLFHVADGRRKAGVRPIGLFALARLFGRQQRLIALYPPSN